MIEGLFRNPLTGIKKKKIKDKWRLSSGTNYEVEVSSRVIISGRFFLDSSLCIYTYVHAHV